MFKILNKFLIIIFVFFIIKQGALANECVDCPGFEEFFRQNYIELIEKLSPDCDRIRIFDILFNAYSIKFKTVDYEYKCAKCALLDDKNEECFSEIRKYLRNLNEIAIEEYDSFLDDLSFEICDDEHFENRTIKKNRKKYKKQLKKLVSKCK